MYESIPTAITPNPPATPQDLKFLVENIIDQMPYMYGSYNKTVQKLMVYNRFSNVILKSWSLWFKSNPLGTPGAGMGGCGNRSWSYIP